MIQIKTCTRDNIDELLRVFTQSYREHYAHYWSDNGDAYINSNFNPDQLGQEMSNPNSTFFLISQGSRSVGILKINMCLVSQRCWGRQLPLSFGVKA